MRLLHFPLLSSGIFVFGAGLAGQITVDFGVNANIAAGAPSPITVPIDLDAAGNALLGAAYVSGADVAPVVEVTGATAQANTLALSLAAEAGTHDGSTFAAGGAFRVAGIGGLGVGNNYTDGGEAIAIAFDTSNLPAGLGIRVLSISFEDTQVADATVYGQNGSAVILTGFVQDEVLDLSSLDTTVGGGRAIIVAGNPGAKFKLDTVTFEIVPFEGGPSDPDFTEGWTDNPMTFGSIYNAAGGWSYVPGYLKWVYREPYPWVWVYGGEGWIHLVFNSDHSFYFYKPGVGWLYSSPTLYPAAWDLTAGAWR